MTGDIDADCLALEILIVLSADWTVRDIEHFIPIAIAHTDIDPRCIP
ncbi:hypothetical protein [Haloplanus litoreus]|uniref:Uncharacterized protein n=1 Tax=Haloplanus litoreus TaxID=767515 RepID=A0ABD6A4T5_9EURY